MAIVTPHELCSHFIFLPLVENYLVLIKLLYVIEFFEIFQFIELPVKILFR
jgi:hypothetical protein